MGMPYPVDSRGDELNPAALYLLIVEFPSVSILHPRIVHHGAFDLFLNQFEPICATSIITIGLSFIEM
jgi:hypothetical protein